MGEGKKGRLKPAVFLDRDGTLNEDVGYPACFEQVHVYTFAPEAVRKVNRAGLAAVVVTHQSGVARGYFTEPDLVALHSAFAAYFRDKGAALDAVYYCPHDTVTETVPGPASCSCHKPLPGLGLRAARELGLDLQASYMIGDKPDDLLFGLAIGARPVLVLTGFGLETEESLGRLNLKPAFIARDVLHAVEWVLNEERRLKA